MCSRNSAKNFEPLICSNCHEFGLEFLKNKFTDEITCVDCINEQLEEIRKEEEEKLTEAEVRDLKPFYDRNGDRIE